MPIRLFPALRRDPRPMPADEPIRRFVETLEALEARRPRRAGGRVRALDPFDAPVFVRSPFARSPFAHAPTRQPRSQP